MSLVGRQHPGQDPRLLVHDVVGQQDHEGLVADVGPGHRHGVAEPERLALAHVVHGGQVGDGAHLGQLLVLAGLLEAVLQLERPVEVVLQARRLPRPVMTRMSVIPFWTASSTTYWMAGLSTRASISLGWALAAGRNRVPSPAAGITAFLTGVSHGRLFYHPQARPSVRHPASGPVHLALKR